MSKFTKFARRLRDGLFPPKLKAGRVHRYLCVGGPFDDDYLHLHTPSTLPLTLHGQTGRYLAHPEDRTKLVWAPEINDHI